MNDKPKGPLAGIRVLELGRYIAAPYAGRLLADMGAEVIKVEDPDGGDPMRRWESAKRPYSPQFAAYNLSKQSVTLDLKSTSDRDALIALARTVDVFIENLRPGTCDRLGIGSGALQGVNPRLIFCSVTGFGAEGPYAMRPSFDTVISALGGLYGLITPADSVAPVGPAMSDTLSGMFAVQAILAALYQRSLTGLGQVVECSMLGAVCGFLTEPITSVMDTGLPIELTTRQRRAQAYGCTASDGKAFIVHLSVPDRFWRALADAMERPDWLDDPRFADRKARHDNYEELERQLREQAPRRTRAEWFERFEERDIPHAPLNRVEDLQFDPQVQAMGLLPQVQMPDGQPPLRSAVAGVQFSRCAPVPVVAPPELGADTDRVLGMVRQ